MRVYIGLLEGLYRATLGHSFPSCKTAVRISIMETAVVFSSTLSQISVAQQEPCKDICQDGVLGLHARFAYWGLVRNMGIYYVGIVLPCSLATPPVSY